MTSNRGGTNAGGPEGEGETAGSRGSLPARRIVITTAAVVVMAIVVTIAFAWERDDSTAAPAGVVAAEVATPNPTLSRAPDPTLAPSATASETPEVTAISTSTGIATLPVTLTPTIDGAWNATPYATTPAPSDPPTPAATLAALIEARYGVRIITAGQDWGADDASQARNLKSVSDALGGAPSGVLADVGQLTFLSNDGGRTEAGWQPYGDRQANYYSNEDVVNGEHIAANQIVLQPGSTAQTIAHEMMHAYQLRGQAPGDYAAALLTPMMKSFMQATGWTQQVSDDEIESDAAESWTAVDADYSYSGRTLTYAGADGAMLSLFAPNPLEAFAEAGGLYYAHASAITLPDWPEYWGWLAANVG